MVLLLVTSCRRSVKGKTRPWHEMDYARGRQEGQKGVSILKNISSLSIVCFLKKWDTFQFFNLANSFLIPWHNLCSVALYGLIDLDFGYAKRNQRGSFSLPPLPLLPHQSPPHLSGNFNLNSSPHKHLLCTTEEPGCMVHCPLPLSYLLGQRFHVFCFEICTPEGRGGEKGGSDNFKTKHTDRTFDPRLTSSSVYWTEK